MARDDFERELQFHVDARTDDLIAAGRSKDDARRQALVEFGGVLQMREACREEKRSQFFAALFQDAAYALRLTRRSPGFAAVATLSAALGIGATTAIFSVIDNLLFRPPPFEHVDRLVCLFDTHPTKVPPDAEVPPSPGNVIDLRARARTFDRIVAWRNWYYPFSDIGGSDRAESLRGVRVSPEFFDMLGVRAEVGRTFAADESRAGRGDVVLLSYSLWSRRFNQDPAVVGHKVLVDARPLTVIGILPRTFQFYQRDLDLWMPLDLESGSRSRQDHSVMTFARLAPGVSVAAAQGELDALARQLAIEHPDTNDGWGIRILPLYPSRDVRDVRPALVVLLAASGVVLLIACVNVATLLLTRGIARRREMVIRAAVGASRSRLIRQILTESLMLASAGGAAGIAVAYAGVNLLVPLLPHAGTNQSLATFGPIAPAVDARVLAFTVALALATGVMFGLLPALQTTRVSFLKTWGAMSVSPRAGRVMVAAELTLSIVLLVCAAVLIESFWNLQAVRPGFRSDRLLTAAVWLPRSTYPPEATSRFYDEALRRVSRLPGAQSAGAISYRPFLSMAMSTRVEVPGLESSSANREFSVGYDVVTPGYLGVIDQPLKRGRDLDEHDSADAEGVAVINETMARRLWPGQDPIGKKVRPAFSRNDVPWAMDARARWLTVVGVAGDIKEFRLDEEPRPLMYISQRQFPSSFMYFMVRTGVPPEMLMPLVRREIGGIDPDVPISNLQTMDDAIANAVPVFDAELFLIFAAIALLLSVIGVYGVASHRVSERTREIAIRMALGADAWQMMTMVIREALVVGLIATGAGIAGALAVTQAMRHMLYGVSPTDPRALGAAAVLLMGAALAASYVPARRAARMEPTIALKWD